jgi:hypothetical protein
MKKFSHLITNSFFAGCVFFSTGCNASEEGIYMYEKDQKEFIELRKDGTFFNTECDNFLTKKCRSFTGKYRVMGNRLILELSTGQASTGSIEGNVIIDPEGHRYIKK